MSLLELSGAPGGATGVFTASRTAGGDDDVFDLFGNAFQRGGTGVGGGSDGGGSGGGDGVRFGDGDNMYGASQQPFGSRGGSANANTVTRVTVGRMECHFIVDPTDTMWFSHAEVRWPLGRLEPLSVFAIGGGARLRAARCEPPQPLFF